MAAVAIGVVLGASPLAWPILATAIGVRAGGSQRPSAPARPGWAGWTIVGLGAGLTVVYASLGLLSGQLDWSSARSWAPGRLRRLAIVAAAGGLLLLLRRTTSCRVLARPLTGAPAAFLLGVPLGIVNCPACAGVITGVAVSAGVIGSTAYSTLVMAALGVGHTLTLLVVSKLSLNAAGEAIRSATGLQRLGGGLLLLCAVFFAFQASAMGTTIQTTLP